MCFGDYFDQIGHVGLIEHPNAGNFAVVGDADPRRLRCLAQPRFLLRIWNFIPEWAKNFQFCLFPIVIAHNLFAILIAWHVHAKSF